MIARIILLLCVTLAATSAVAQQQPKAEKIVTNGELTPGKEFHLLLIHDGGNYSAHVASMLRQPRGEMAYWSQSCNVRLMAASEPQAMEHHADLLQKHGNQLPILALIQQTADDGRGAVWCSAAGNQIPSTEAGLASWLNTYFEATARAAQESNQLAVVAGPRNLAQAWPSNKSQGSYFLNRAGGAPGPYSPSGLSRPVEIDIPRPIADATDRATQAAIGFAILAIVCCLILGSAHILHGVILGHAITEDEKTE